MARMHYKPALATGAVVGLGARGYLRRKATKLSKAARRVKDEIKFLRKGIGAVPESSVPDLMAQIGGRRDALMPLLKHARRYRMGGRAALIGSAVIGYGASRFIAQVHKRQAIRSVAGQSDTPIRLPSSTVHHVQDQPIQYTGPIDAPPHRRDLTRRQRERVLQVLDKLHGVKPVESVYGTIPQ
jgi:hypothetical protein